MNKTEDDELGNEELSDEEIRALSEGLFLLYHDYWTVAQRKYIFFCLFVKDNIDQHEC